MSELFLAIFNTAVTAGWLVLAVLVARLLLKNAPGWAKCALWAIVGIRLVWPFELESILSLVPSAQTLPPAELYDYTPEIHTGIYAVNSTINPVFTETFLSGPQNSVNPLQIVVMIASVLWIVGMVAMAGYALVSYLRLRRRVAVSIPAGEGVYLCDAIFSPFILGLVKPKIFLPSELPREQWDAILSHERAHLARRDHWWKPLGFALLTVFWFHPLLWVAYILLCRDVELACDEKVIKALTPEEKQAYSQTLLECSMPRKWITACPLAFGETGVKQRIKAVLHYKKTTLWIMIAALIVCSVLAVCFLTEPMHDRAVMLFDRDHPDTTLQGNVKLESFRNATVRWDFTSDHTSGEENPVLVKDGKENILFEDYPEPSALYVADVTGDGKPDLCADVYYFFSGLPSFNAVCVYDIVTEQYYLLGNENMFLNQWVSYYLRIEDGKLVCDKFTARGDIFLATGTLFLADTGENMTLCFEPQNGPVTEADVANKQYVYTKPGAGSAFYIDIYADGTFRYYAGNYSSHIGLGDWELKAGKLYLYDNTLTNPMTFVFAVEEEQLTYIAAESHPFMYVDVSNGDIFRCYSEIVPSQKAVTEADIAGKMYVYQSEDSSPGYQIWIKEDGTFFYPEAGLSSAALYKCYWELKDGKLYLHEGSKTFVFRVERDALIYLAEESDSFMMLNVADGDRFNFYCDFEQMNPVTAADLAGKSFTCYYKRELDQGFFTDWFTLMLYEDGSCRYHTSGLSSQMHDGTWNLEDGKLYIQYETAGGSAGMASFDVKADCTLYLTSPFYTLSEGAKFETPQSNLVWIEVTTLNDENNYIIGKDNQGNYWRILLTKRMTRRNLENINGGVWVSYYGEPKKLNLSTNSLRYEVTAEACWQFVEDDALSSRENVRGWVYDYCLYDVDNDGNVEECIISMGHTSGLFTIHYSVWQDGECEEEKLLYVNFAEGFAFAPDENGLAILSSEGDRIYPGLYSNGVRP